MKQILSRLLPFFLALVLLTGCKAYTLTDYLPDLIVKETQLPGITSITVKRLSDGAGVTLTEASALNEMMLHVEGIQGSRTEESLETFSETYPAQYEIQFTDASGSVVLTVCGEEEFHMAGYSWLAVRGGMDLFYLDSLFAQTDAAAAE
ncbi:MAG: hypothetical protein IJ480_12145 [Clostridia bacterium]|nr:hypothetical protein [Clostridia bacterium]